MSFCTFLEWVQVANNLDELIHYKSGTICMRGSGFSFYVYLYVLWTGIKFIVVADPRQTTVDALLKKIYEVYSDFALKNPFYSMDMPIRYGIPFIYSQNLYLTISGLFILLILYIALHIISLFL